MNDEKEKLKVMVEGKVKIQVENEKQAEAIANAVNPENKLMKGFEIETFAENSQVVTVFRNEITIRSLKATLDDLLEAIILAKEVSEAVKQ